MEDEYGQGRPLSSTRSAVLYSILHVLVSHIHCSCCSEEVDIIVNASGWPLTSAGCVLGSAGNFPDDGGNKNF